MDELKRIFICFFLFFCFNGKAQSINCLEIYRKWEKENFPTLLEEKRELMRLMDGVRKDKYCYVSLFKFLGEIYRKESKLDSAIIIFSLAAEKFDSLKYYIGVGAAYHDISMVHKQLGNYKDAMHFLKLSLNCHETHHIAQGIGSTTKDIAELYYMWDSLETAEKYCKRSISAQITNNFVDELSSTYGMLGFIYLETNRKKLAENCAGLSEKALKNTTNTWHKMAAIRRLGELYFELGDANKSFAFLRQAYRIAKEQNDEVNIAMLEENLVYNFEETHQYDSALKYSKLSNEYRVKVAQANVANAMANASVKYETEKKELELKNQQQETESSHKLNIMLSGGLGLMLILVIFMIMFYTQRRKSQKQEAELERANAMIKGQDAERERIAAELHDRVGSMLSAAKLQFSMLLDANEKYAGGPSPAQALEMLDESYDEVRRISHDLDTGLLSRFGLHTALNRLAKGIESTSQMRVRYIDNGIRQELTKDMQTELYRITQELLSNTIKYARAKEVSVQLNRDEQNLVYSYEDDGVGFEKTILQKSAGIGYTNIETRVNRLKGKLHIDTSPGNGTSVIIEIPIT